MSYRLLRTLALASAVTFGGLSSAACGGQNEGRSAVNVNLTAKGGASSEAAGGVTPAGTGTQQIEMGDDVFRPVLLTVAAGTKVTWVNKGSKAHTVVSNDKRFDSGLVNVGGEFSNTFDAPGTYSYHCAPHAKMIGQIVVK